MTDCVKLTVFYCVVLLLSGSATSCEGPDSRYWLEERSVVWNELASKDSVELLFLLSTEGNETVVVDSFPTLINIPNGPTIFFIINTC